MNWNDATFAALADDRDRVLLEVDGLPREEADFLSPHARIDEQGPESYVSPLPAGSPARTKLLDGQRVGIWLRCLGEFEVSERVSSCQPALRVGVPVGGASLHRMQPARARRIRIVGRVEVVVELVLGHRLRSDVTLRQPVLERNSGANEVRDRLRRAIAVDQTRSISLEQDVEGDLGGGDGGCQGHGFSSQYRQKRVPLPATWPPGRRKSRPRRLLVVACTKLGLTATSQTTPEVCTHAPR